MPQYMSPAIYQPMGEEAKQRRKAAAERRQQQAEQATQQQKAGRQARQAAAAKRQVGGRQRAGVGPQVQDYAKGCMSSQACDSSANEADGTRSPALVSGNPLIPRAMMQTQDDEFEYDADLRQPDRERVAAAAEARLKDGSGGSQPPPSQQQQQQQQHFMASAVQVRQGVEH